MKKKFMAIALTIALICMIVPTVAFAEGNTDVSTLADLKTALGSASSGDTITLTDMMDVPASETIAVPTGVVIKYDGGGFIFTAGATYTVGGNTVIGAVSNANAVLQMIDGEIFIRQTPFDEDIVWVYLTGEAIANKDISSANGIDYLVVSNEPKETPDGPDWDELTEAKLTVNKDITISCQTELRGEIIVNSGGILRSGNNLKHIDVNHEDFGGGGRVKTYAGGKFYKDGSLLFGAVSDNDATFQIEKGNLKYGCTAWDQSTFWVYVEGTASLNKNFTICAIMLGFDEDNDCWCELTVKKGVKLTATGYKGWIDGIQGGGTLIYLTDTGKTVSSATGTPSDTAVSGDTTTANTTVTADLTGVSATNKLDLKIKVNDDIYFVIAEATTSKVEIDIVVSNDILNNANVRISELSVPKYIFDTAKEENKTVEFAVTNESGKLLYSWTFDSGTIKNDDNTVEMNLSLSISKNLPAAVLDDNALVISFNHDGTLPTTDASVKIFVGEQGFISGDKLFFYYFNPTTNKYEFIAKELVVDADGYVTVTITHCSDYVLTKTDLNKSNESNPDNASPQTGDNSNILPILAIAMTSLGVLMFAMAYRKRKHILK